MAEEKKVSEKELANYAKHYDKNAAYKLLKKLRKATRGKPAIIAGPTGAIVSTLGKLLSALANPDTPAPLKALIVGTIGYILLPIDLIPDMIPVMGYTDDLASATGVIIAVASYSNFSLADLDAELDAEGWCMVVHIGVGILVLIVIIVSLDYRRRKKEKRKIEDIKKDSS